MEHQSQEVFWLCLYSDVAEEHAEYYASDKVEDDGVGILLMHIGNHMMKCMVFR